MTSADLNPTPQGRTQMPITLDRHTKDSAVLTLADGSQYDVYGADWSEMKADAIALASSLGVEIEIFNSEVAE